MLLSFIPDGGHNTDAFDVGSSTGVYISGANVKNQDDCLAISETGPNLLGLAEADIPP